MRGQRGRRGRQHRDRARQPAHARLGQAEVEELRAAFRQHDVCRLEIAMDHAGAMSGVERGGDLDRDAEGVVHWQPAFLEPRGQRLALQELHDEEGCTLDVADVVQRADVRVGRAARSCALHARSGRETADPPRGRAGRTLIATVAIEARVARAVDLAHAPGTERRDDLVGAEPGSSRQAHEPL